MPIANKNSDSTSPKVGETGSGDTVAGKLNDSPLGGALLCPDLTQRRQSPSALVPGGTMENARRSPQGAALRSGTADSKDERGKCPISLRAPVCSSPPVDCYSCANWLQKHSTEEQSDAECMKDGMRQIHRL